MTRKCRRNRGMINGDCIRADLAGEREGVSDEIQDPVGLKE
jgi:hypothetical protein